MKTLVLVLILYFCVTQMFFAQEENGVVSLSIPVRNSLTFNRYAISPTFSFVREQNKYISMYNKREWVQFEDAPITYLASYTGRFAENIGAGFGMFQQDYGILTTFGGVINFAYNARLARESNLTFGLNIGAYKSGLNTGNVVGNFDDPSLSNIPENFLMTINPGINYGLAFLDFGVSVNNLVVYNFESSTLVKNNPERGIQAHLMYTGYMYNKGFFDESKFSGLIRSEFRKDQTIVSAIAMLTIPKGIWAQAGYNTVYGASGGIGLNITSQFAIEYNFETTMGDLSEFGPSHDITLAYRFKNKETYYYSSDDVVVGLIPKAKRKVPVSKISKEKAEANRKLAAERKAQLQAKRLANQKAKEEAATEAKLLAEQKAKEEAKAKAIILAEQKGKEEAAAEARLLAEQKAKEEAETKARLLAEQKANEEAEEEAKLLIKEKAKEEALETLISNQKDEIGKAMYAITQKTASLKEEQDQLLNRFNEIVNIKDQDLKDLKVENDLSEQGVLVEPKPFKSITAENNLLKATIADLDNVIKSRNLEMKQLKKLYEDKFKVDTIYLDEMYMYYNKTLGRLSAEQIETAQAKLKLQLRLDDIKVATVFERNRRIKRATFENEEERYNNDRSKLLSIKQTTTYREQPYKIEDFDFGEVQSSNIQILKNINHVNNGYYLTIAVHSDTRKRDDFITKVVASGRKNVDFFYDENTSKYYIYYEKFDSIETANEALKSKEKRLYNTKMSLVKIEN